MTQPPRNRPPSRKVAQPERGSSPQGRQGRNAPPPPQGRRNNYYAQPPRRDPFPIVIGAIMGVLVIGLLVLVYMLASNQNRGGVQTPVVQGQNTAPGGGAAATVVTTDPNATAGPTEEPAPRMPLADFMTLYNDPAKRPIIIDVRAKEAYDAGHIAGAISFPESDVDTRLSELPKDKLVVAYCQ
jgi:hypothetical protein